MSGPVRAGHSRGELLRLCEANLKKGNRGSSSGKEKKKLYLFGEIAGNADHLLRSVK